MTPRVLIALPLPDELSARIAAVCEPVQAESGIFPDAGELERLAPGLDGVVLTMNNRFDAALLARCGRLRVLSNCAVGIDNIDVAAATAQRIVVCNTPGVQDTAVAEQAIALVMALARNLVSNDAYIRSGEWQRRRHAPLGTDIAGKRLGLIGLGGIGREVARLGAALGMDVIYWKPTPDEGAAARYVSRDEVFATSDVVSLHLPLTAATRGIVGAAEFARMKPGAFLVNTARGAVTDEAALAAALRSGHLGGAGLDVMATEPLPPNHELCGLPTVILQPHAAGATRETRRRMERAAVTNLLAVLAGDRPRSVVNPEAVDRHG